MLNNMFRVFVWGIITILSIAIWLAPAIVIQNIVFSIVWGYLGGSVAGVWVVYKVFIRRNYE